MLVVLRVPGPQKLLLNIYYHSGTYLVGYVVFWHTYRIIFKLLKIQFRNSDVNLNY